VETPDRLTIVEFGIDAGHVTAEQVKAVYAKRLLEAEKELERATQNMRWIEAKIGGLHD